MNISTLCLGILHFDDATGYEINKLVTEGRFSHFIEASYGSIYPTLTKMMAAGFVTCRTEAQDGRPSRKIYSITDAGREHFLMALKETPQPNRFKSEFLFVGLFADLLPSSHMAEVVAQNEARLTEKVSHMREAYERCKHPGSQFALGYGIAANEAALNYLRENKNLLILQDEKPQTTSKTLQTADETE
jgi:DNA-binding PadR family transcriptional regulator